MTSEKEFLIHFDMPEDFAQQYPELGRMLATDRLSPHVEILRIRCDESKIEKLQAAVEEIAKAIKPIKFRIAQNTTRTVGNMLTKVAVIDSDALFFAADLIDATMQRLGFISDIPTRKEIFSIVACGDTGPEIEGSGFFESLCLTELL